MKMKMKKGKSVIQSILDPVKSKEKGEERDQECWGASNTQYYVNESLVCIQYNLDQMLLQFTVLKYYYCSNFAPNQNS